MALTEKQALFAAEYIVDFNATAAAVRAGYSERTASQKGYALLQNPEIMEEVKRGIDERVHRTRITQDYVLEKLKEIADQEAGDEIGSHLRYGNKIRALELLGKHVGLFEPKNAALQRDAEDDPLTASLKEWMKQNGH